MSGSDLESDIESVTAKIDRTKPTASHTLSPEDWATESVTIALHPADEGGAGLAGVKLPNGETVSNDFANIHFPVSYRFNRRYSQNELFPRLLVASLNAKPLRLAALTR